MGNYFEPVLSEEQMAAYLDGMLPTDESAMVEELILSNQEMQEIQDAIDSVDYTYIYDSNEEIPLECMTDYFTLPNIDYNYDDSYRFSHDEENDYEVENCYNDPDVNHEELNELNNYQEEPSSDNDYDNLLNNEINDVYF